MASHCQERMISHDGNDEEAQNGLQNADGKKNSLGQCFEASPMVVDPTLDEPEKPYSCSSWVLNLPHTSLLRKVVAEIISTYCLVFAGCGAAIVNTTTEGVVSHVGIAATFGIVVMIMVYSVGHISGAHLNPAVTLAFATVRHFPWKEVPLYIGAQIGASICAAFSLRLIFGNVGTLGATLPVGDVGQSFALEVIITFILMFVVAAVATDTRAVGELAGIAVGATVGMNALYAGPISGASMNPARTIGPAVASNNYKAIWIYIIGPVVGAVFGAWGYALIRGPEPSAAEQEQLRKAKSLKR